MALFKLSARALFVKDIYIIAEIGGKSNLERQVFN